MPLLMVAAWAKIVALLTCVTHIVAARTSISINIIKVILASFRLRLAILTAKFIPAS